LNGREGGAAALPVMEIEGHGDPHRQRHRHR
jgi:hypothetical protein